MRRPNDSVLGVLGTSRKTDEHRVPIHPDHLERIDRSLRSRMVLEEGYGDRFGYTDDEIRQLVGGVTDRAGVISAAGTVLLAKPQAADLEQLKDGQTLWGWQH